LQTDFESAFYTTKESVRAKLKVIVKRTLRQYGYPPDMQLLATETVLRQAEKIAAELTTTPPGAP
jgi:type I restriction enzyme, R subunit